MQSNKYTNGPVLPSTTINNNLAFADPKEGDLAQIAASSMLTYGQQPTANLVNSFQAKHGDQGQYLTEDQWKKGPFYRQGLSFPKGVSTNAAIVAASRYDVLTTARDRLNDAEPGAASWLSRKAGQLIGFAGDPINAVTGFGVGKFIADPLIAKLSETAVADNLFTRIGAHAAVGALEGGLDTTPSATSQYYTNNQLGQKTTIAQVMSGIGDGVGFGAFFRGIGGVGKPVPNEAYQQAKSMAVGQVLNENAVDVMPVLRNGYLKSVNSKLPIDQAEFAAVKQDLNDKLSTANDQVDEQQGVVDELSKKSPTVQKNVDSNTLVENVSDVLNKDIPKRSLKEQRLVVSNQDNDPIMTAVHALTKDQVDRTPRENTLLDAVTNGKERNVHIDNIDTHQHNIADMQSQLKELKEDKPHIRDSLNSKLDIEKHKLDMAQNRVNELDGLPSYSKKLKEAKVKLSIRKQTRNNFKELSNEHDIDYWSKPNKLEDNLELERQTETIREKTLPSKLGRLLKKITNSKEGEYEFRSSGEKLPRKLYKLVIKDGKEKYVGAAKKIKNNLFQFSEDKSKVMPLNKINTAKLYEHINNKFVKARTPYERTIYRKVKDKKGILKFEKVGVLDEKTAKEFFKDLPDKYIIDRIKRPSGKMISKIRTSYRHVPQTIFDEDARSVQPVTLSDLKATFNYLNSSKGDLAYNPQMVADLDKNLENTHESEDEEIQYVLDQLKNTKKDGAITDALNELIEDTDKLDSRTTTLKDALIKTIKCELGK